MKLQIEDKQAYLHIALPPGSFSLDAVKRLIDGMAEACRKRRCMKTFFDWRPMISAFSLTDRFEIGVYAARTLPKMTKVAVLLREDQFLPEKFFETVVRNRELNLRVFVDSQEAIQWLKTIEREVAA